ncbi:hypothetical protein FOZ62_001516, partial [Perkinsus olseni]
MSAPPGKTDSYPSAPPPMVVGQQYQQQQPQMFNKTEAVFVQPPAAVVYMPSFGDDPVRLTCPSCRCEVITSVKHNISCGTWLAVLLVCLVFWPLAWLPCCIDSCKQADHTCPNCGGS